MFHGIKPHWMKSYSSDKLDAYVLYYGKGNKSGLSVKINKHNNIPHCNIILVKVLKYRYAIQLRFDAKAIGGTKHIDASLYQVIKQLN